MTALLAIDPGAMSGFAYFQDGRLLHAWADSPDVVACSIGRIDVLALEWPQIYPNSKARPKDIVTLAGVAGRYVERYRDAELHRIAPRDWKGTIDGDIMTDRITAALTEDERRIVGYGRLDHNMLDAVGLGKWALRQPWMRVRK